MQHFCYDYFSYLFFISGSLLHVFTHFARKYKGICSGKVAERSPSGKELFHWSTVRTLCNACMSISFFSYFQFLALLEGMIFVLIEPCPGLIVSCTF